MQRPTTRRIGLLILLCATILYAVSTWWIKTRDYIPLEVPFNLAPGKTAHAIDVNLTGNYEFLIVLQKEPQFQGNLQCLLFGCSEQSIALHTKWALKQNNREIARGSSDDQRDETNFGLYGMAKIIGSHWLSRGNYTLELDTFNSSDALGLGRPTIVVIADGKTYTAASHLYEVLLVLSCVIGAIAIGIALLPFRSPNSPPLIPGSTARPKAVSLAAPDRVTRFTPTRRVSPPAYGISAAILFACVVLVMMVITGDNRVSHGLWVTLLPPHASIPQPDPYTAPIVVHVTSSARKRPPSEMAALQLPPYEDREFTDHFLLNHEDLTEAALKQKLRELLVTRADRTVYILGDNDNMAYSTIATAIDAAKSSYASRVVLLTKQPSTPPPVTAASSTADLQSSPHVLYLCSHPPRARHRPREQY